MTFKFRVSLWHCVGAACLLVSVWAGDAAAQSWVSGSQHSDAQPKARSASSKDSADPSSRTGAQEVYQGWVSRVIDGDTLWVKPLAGGPYRKLRLDGLDAPESCQRGGLASRAALAARVLKRVVTVRVRAFDDYGRALAQVQHNGGDVGAALVLEGHAWSYRWRSNPGLYTAEEAHARASQKGVFAEADALPPWTFRRRNGPCRWK